ncbi:hypothetical protein D3C86_1719440 [compost metagenome]
MGAQGLRRESARRRSEMFQCTTDKMTENLQLGPAEHNICRHPGKRVAVHKGKVAHCLAFLQQIMQQMWLQIMRQAQRPFMGSQRAEGG